MTRKESECESTFHEMKQVYNANTPENHPVIFKTENDYKAAMSILAICARMFPDITIYAFQIMSNHLHLVIGGDRTMILQFHACLVERLRLYFDGKVDLSAFLLKLFHIQDLAYLRNAMVYVNRNAFVVNNDVTPFSYPWGSSRYFFQPLSSRYDELAWKAIGLENIRSLMHSRKFDHLKKLRVVDGVVSPLEFCDFRTAEMVFRDAKQYFYAISRNVETYSEIARSIGEEIYYNDTDLYNAAVKLSKDQYGSFDLRTLSADAKLGIAKRLHFDYNAGDKQLQRILSIDGALLKALF